MCCFSTEFGSERSDRVLEDALAQHNVPSVVACPWQAVSLMKEQLPATVDFGESLRQDNLKRREPFFSIVLASDTSENAAKTKS